MISGNPLKSNSSQKEKEKNIHKNMKKYEKNE